tara:strand:- start:35612 stop:35938 length:327 start_codon:yes stop_codon:yes gene_type:complete
MLLSSITQAENFPSHRSTADDDYYGQIDDIYTDESRLIINDISINYSNRSLFLDNRGDTILNIDKLMKLGLYVKYHISPTMASDFLLIDLKIISEKEFNDIKDEATIE